ncbi:ATP-binding protein [Umezawaea sp. NPDC059074]|uniref:ATP-binding protein n=1 Tax=Umezawaea sp. NPDC059074 TaxID=3346716 RepID=UPI0036BDEDE7
MSELSSAGESGASTELVRNEITASTAGHVIQAGRIGQVNLSPPRPVTPRQLPAAPRDFIGRAIELSALSAALTHGSVQGSVMAIAVIRGTGGVGKTWLALRWAHRHISQFPDGQLFVDLHGFSPTSEPMDPKTALEILLEGLGVPHSGIPVEQAARVGLYRSLVAGRRMLIVLDNAANSAQVSALLPGSPTCTVVVTSRSHMPDLVVAHGAPTLPLDVLDVNDARELLSRQLGSSRVAAEPEAAKELVDLCGGLPLALSVIAARAAIQPAFPLSAFTEELHKARLDALDAGEPNVDVRVAVSCTYLVLPLGPATVFRMLGSAPGPDISLSAVAVLAELPDTQARKQLRELERFHLVQQYLPDRYRMHDLIRIFAVETAHSEDGASHLTTALRRLIDFYARTARRGDEMLNPSRLRIQAPPADTGTEFYALPNSGAAQAWFREEHRCLLASQKFAAQQGWHPTVWVLAWAMATFHRRTGNLHDHLDSWRRGLLAAGHLGKIAARTEAHRRLGFAYAREERSRRALKHFRRALALACQDGDIVEQAETHMAFMWMLGRQGDIQRALNHAVQALRLSQLADQPTGDALNAVGYFHARLGVLGEARAYCEAAIVELRRHGDVEGQANALDTFGYIAYRDGRCAEAVGHYREALALFRRMGNAYDEADTLDHLGRACDVLGRYLDARRSWRQALGLYAGQHRLDDADRIRRQLDSLERRVDFESVTDDGRGPHQRHAEDECGDQVCGMG